MIKKITGLATILAIGSTISFAQKNNTTITGNIKDLKDTQIVIHSYYQSATSKPDTVKVKDGKLTWATNLDEPKRMLIMFSGRYFPFYADKGKIQITGTADSLYNLTVKGSKTQDEANAYEAANKDISDQESPLYQKYGKGTKEEQLALETKLQELRNERTKRSLEYISSHPNSFYAASMVADKASMGNYEDVNTAYQKLSPATQQSTIGKQIAERLDILKRSSTGVEVLNFTQNNTEGQPVSFTSFKGKYVLIDFWASWCGPCRAENPNVLKAYNKYKDKNFTVLGISLDDKEANWKKAIKDDAMPWSQLSDLKGWKNEVSTYYGIQGIPSTLLVGPDGKIIAKNLRGELLNKKLSELFD